MTQTRKPVALALGAAVATGTLLAGSMFSMQAMAQGYMQDTAKTTAAEGKCGEGKCGEGKCGGDKAAAKGGGASVGKPNHGNHHTMTAMDTDGDGRMSRAEFAAAHEGSADKFGTYDADGDGFISQAEMDAKHAGMKKATTEGKCGEGKCGEGKCGSKT